jgi:chromate transporter
MVAASGLTVAAATLLNLSAWTGEIVSAVGVINWKGVVLAIVVYLGTNKFKLTKDLHPIWFIAVSAVVGILLHFA